ncbi:MULTISPECIES: hypothetical protein [Vreelandella]|uniref:hypothetical protein n=1 Tax=Halomonadaceae TaxID=28256 RepID=UPI00167516BA|nr:MULTISPECIES: hypothetical protein [Halomonas]
MRLAARSSTPPAGACSTLRVRAICSRRPSPGGQFQQQLNGLVAGLLEEGEAAEP